MFTAIHTILTGVTTQDRTRQELESLVGELARVEAHAVERRLAVTAAIDALDDGGIGGADVTRAKARRSTRDAKKAAKTAQALNQMPKTRAALARGAITEAHADAAADAAERVSPAEADALADDAAGRPADLFGTQARSWASAREREQQKTDRQARLRAAREVSTWTDANGMWCLFGRFDPETGQELTKALRQTTDRLWREDGGRDGRPDEVRTPAQRRADAVHELMVRPASAGSGKRPHPKHLVGVRVDAGRCTSGNPTGVAEFIDGTPLPQSTLERIACGAEFVGMVFGADGETLWQGRRQRVATEAQWANLVIRDGGCFCCGADPANCQAHHIVAWQPPGRGPTDIDNLVLSCSRTHHLVHEHGHQIIRIDGKWTLAPPGEQRRAA
ncbi:MAG: DUF222 domain-containing protein [Acidimicrobiales bacterium]